MSKGPIRISEEYFCAAVNNDFVAGVNEKTGKLYYSKDFYVVMNKLLKNGTSPIEAYKAMGFDIKIFGTDRAYAAAQRAKKMANKQDYTTTSPAAYDGSVPREKMGELTPEEENAYMKARIMYLEYWVEVQKKRRKWSGSWNHPGRHPCQ